MSKAIWVYSREKIVNNNEKKILEICMEISPDNIIPRNPKIRIKDNIGYGLTNPSDSIKFKDNSILLGTFFEKCDNWNLPQQEYPDGTYAIFREDRDYCEIVTDSVASRTIWYFINEKMFIASTSQIAIVRYIENFEFNERAIPWMLSTGSLGPDFSWDKRMKRLQPASSIILDKQKWVLTKKSEVINFEPDQLSKKHHEKKITKILNSVISSIDVDFTKWAIPISGGYDSRVILNLLKKNGIKNLNSITWGLKDSIKNKKNDAYVAKEVARRLSVSHKYYHTNLSNEPLTRIFERFIKNGEGRIDQISAYLDGFDIWATLYKDNVQGIIRGDEGFGWSKVSSELVTRISVGLSLCSDYVNFNQFKDRSFLEQELPNYLRKLRDESLEQWRDRLYHQYRIPTILAALTDLKASYLEIANPLLSKKILLEVRKMPDILRTEKSLFKKIVMSIGSNIPVAKHDATISTTDFLKRAQVVEILKNEISTNLNKDILPEDFLQYILGNIKNSDHKSIQIKKILKQILPLFIKNILKDKLSSFNSIDFNVLAFRIYIIFKMHDILNSHGVNKKADLTVT